MARLAMTANPLAGLNPKQREAVETIDGPLLILAGPGSGKTRVITHRIAHLVQERGVWPSRIGAVTFTNKAAREMRERLFGVSEDDPAAPLLGWEFRNRGLAVSTFHSFCAQVLRTDGEAVRLPRDFIIYDDSDQVAVVKAAMEEVNVDPKKFTPRAVLSAVSGAKSQLVDAAAFGARKGEYWDEVVHRTYERYERMLQDNSAVDFDDLLVKAHTLLRDVPEVAERYQERYLHFMVDEFQDTNVAQYAIARLISGRHRNLCVVGDPDQSIYSWRNADIRNILSFQSDFPEAKVVTLEENYRSTQTILDAAHNLIAPNERRVEKELWTKNGKGAPVVVNEVYDAREEAQAVVREVDRLARDGECERAGIAVMYRVNAQSRDFEEACTRYGVPYQLVGGLRFYQRREVKDLIAYLRLVANPDDDVSFARVVNVPLRGIGQRTMEELTRTARSLGVSMFTAIGEVSAGGRVGSLQPRAIRALSGFRALIEDMSANRAGMDLPALLDRVVERTGYLGYVREDEMGDERLENIEELRSAAAADYSGTDAGEALTEFLERVSLVSDTDNLEDERDAVTLITLHQAKGLEFPVVFMVGMEEGLLPHARSLEDAAEMEEERRLAYVGVTRAKERLYLTHARRRGFMGGYGPREPSRFLDDIPDRLIEPMPAGGLSGFGMDWGADVGVTAFRRPSETTMPGIGDGVRPVQDAVRSLPMSAKRVRRQDAEEEQARASLPSLSTGDKVRHAKFGEGIVTGTKPSGSDVEVTVAFADGQGVKRLLLSFAKLEKLG